MNSEEVKIAYRVSIITIVINFILSAFKLLAGIFGRSGAMISDAVHSASDVFSTVIVMIGVKISGKASDKSHPYGHERLECVAASLLSVVLFLTGCGIGYSGLVKIISGNYESLTVPSALALSAAIVSIVVKEAMYWYTKHYAKKINSTSLMADAWHHRSDAFSSVGSLVGIGGAMLGIPVLDPIASVVICLFIIKASISIFLEAVNKMVDKACDDKLVDSMKNTVMAVKNVVGIDEFKSRMFGSKIYVDIEVSADKNLTFEEAHDVAENVHHAIEQDFDGVKHCAVHVNPVDTAAE